MATKREELGNLNGCLARSQEDEPVFILVARDRFAPFAVDQWANWAELGGASLEKVAEARQLAREMREWQLKHGSKIPD